MAQKSPRYWRSTLDRLPIPAFVMDADNSVIAGNRLAEELAGQSFSSCRGRKCWELFHGPDKAGPAEACPLRRMTSGTRALSSQLPLTVGGTSFIASCSPSLDAEGRLELILHTFTEIGAGATREAAIGNSAVKDRALLAADTGTWEWDLRTGQATIDERSASLLGYSLDELNPGCFQKWMSLKHPDDRRLCEESLLRHVRGETSSYRCESRMRHRDGRWVWIEGRGAVVERDRDGAALRVFGTHSDVSLRKENELEMRELLAQKELILKEVHHRVKNNMHILSSLFALQASTLDDPASVAALEDAGSRVQAMMILYDKLYQSSDFGSLRVAPYLSSLVDEIVAGFPGTDSLRIRKEIEDFELGERIAVPLGIIVNELLTNSLKYAFPGRKDGLIAVSVGVSGERVRVVVEDDGVGIRQGRAGARPGSFGLTLVEALATQIGGTLRYEGGKGTRAVLAFPLRGK
jgi:PAS domain S-box-containing protein